MNWTGSVAGAPPIKQPKSLQCLTCQTSIKPEGGGGGDATSHENRVAVRSPNTRVPSSKSSADWQPVKPLLGSEQTRHGEVQETMVAKQAPKKEEHPSLPAEVEDVAVDAVSRGTGL